MSRQPLVARRLLRLWFVAGLIATPAAAPGWFIGAIGAVAGVARLTAQAAMPDPRLVSGVPLPAADLPAGTITVRVIRGSFANNLSGVDVVFNVDGKATTVKTDASGRAQIEGLAPGAHVQAVTVVGRERLESQQVTVATTGVRFVLAASDPNTPMAGAAPSGAAGPMAGAAGSSAAVSGTVTLGSETRIVAEFSGDRLNIYYAIPVLNGGSSPADIGGPLLFDLPAGARGVSLMEGTTPQATVNGPRVTVLGPFAPGTTSVNFSYELPYTGGTAYLLQRWPAPLAQVNVFALRTGELDLVSSQLPNKQFRTEQGEAIVVASGPSIPAGQALDLTITGLPHHPLWPRYTALTLAAVILALGIWAAVVPGRRPIAA
ncbi:MAG: carboxypeptidase-like regulatory domain-containing protein [Acidobacteriota bacterium]